MAVQSPDRLTAGFEKVLDAPKDAPWLVMVHGMSQDRRVFSSQVEAFRDRFRILLIDLPGHGLSADVPGPFGHSEFANAVVQATQQAGVNRCHYWGTHTGATVGLLLAVSEPEQFASLILEGPVMPGEAPTSVAGALGQAREVARTDGIEAAKTWWFAETPWFKVMHDNPIDCRRADHKKIVDDFTGAPWLSDATPSAVAFASSDLHDLSMPVLVYNGEHDHPDFLSTAKTIATLIPGCRHEVIEKGGGFPAWEYPEQVNALLRDFLGE